MKTEKEIYNAIKWDPRFNESLFTLEYKDKGTEYIRVPFSQFNPHGDIPWHRVRRFYFKHHLIWDRDNKIELLDEVNRHEAFSQTDDCQNQKQSEIPVTSSTGYVYHSQTQQWRSLPPHQHLAPFPDDAVTLLTCNVLCDTYEAEKAYSHLRYPKLVKWLRNIADIIHLQEVTPEFAGLLLEQEWVREHYYVSDTPQTLWKPFGSFTLSRLPMAEVMQVFIAPEKRPALISAFHLNEQMLFSVNLHLSSNRRGGMDSRQQQAHALHAFLSGKGAEHIIAAGDFNFNDDSEALQMTRRGYIDLNHYFCGDAVNNTFDPERNDLARQLSPMGTPRRMDRIYLQSSRAALLPAYFELIEAVEFSPGQFLTDHFPLLSEFSINHQYTSSPTVDYAAHAEIQFFAEGFASIPLITDTKPLFFEDGVRDLLTGSVPFAIAENKQGDEYILSTSPKNSLEHVQNMLLSCYPESEVSADRFKTSKIKTSRRTAHKALLSELKDAHQNLWPVDLVYLEPAAARDPQFSPPDMHPAALEVSAYLQETYSLELIGSYLLHAAVESSDIDFYSDEPIEVLQEKLKQEFSPRMAGKRSRCIKFEFKGFCIDIQFDRDACTFNKQLAAHYRNHPEKQRLLRQIKYWAERRKIHKQAFGYLSGTAWAILLNEVYTDGLDIVRFLQQFDLSALPLSYTEAMTLSSTLRLQYERKRFLGLMRVNWWQDAVCERNFTQQSHLELTLSTTDSLSFQADYLKLARHVEKMGGLLDIIHAECYHLFLFGLNNPRHVLEQYLIKEAYSDFDISRKRG